MEKKKKKQTRIPAFSGEFFIDFANNFGFLIDTIKPDDTWTEKLFKKYLYDTSKVPEARIKLTKLLDRIIRDQRLDDSEELQYFIEVCEHHYPAYKLVNGRVSEDWIPGRTGFDMLIYPYWLRDLSLSLINFLQNPPTIIRKIRKCDFCEGYYVAKAPNQKYCDDKCKRRSKWTPEEWNAYMKKWRKKYTVEKDNEEIKIFMRIFGISEEEARKQIEEDRNM